MSPLREARYFKENRSSLVKYVVILKSYCTSQMHRNRCTLSYLRQCYSIVIVFQPTFASIDNIDFDQYLLSGIVSSSLNTGNTFASIHASRNTPDLKVLLKISKGLTYFFANLHVEKNDQYP